MGAMSLTLDLPDDLTAALAEEGLDAAGLRESLFIGLYQQGRITGGRLAALVGIERLELDGWLNDRGVPPTYELDDFRAEVAALDGFSQERQRRCAAKGSGR